MKAKTFTYNEMIKFFIDNRQPLTKQQVSLIGEKVKEEIDKINAFKAKRKAKKEAEWLKRQNKKQIKEQQNA